MLTLSEPLVRSGNASDTDLAAQFKNVAPKPAAVPKTVKILTIDDCVSIGQFKQVAKSILQADTGRIDWLIRKAEEKFSKSGPGNKSAPGYQGLCDKLTRLKVYYDEGISTEINEILLRRAFRSAGATASLPLPSRKRTRAEACLYEPE
ncbi:MAG: hypothetical protein PHE24_04570 [Patescibacteria group bacterium]|nr:hypothetical protein [Patescibacteria group bacterium]